MYLDVEEFIHCLEGCELTKEQKVSIIETVYAFMEAQVDIAFGIHPVQLACGLCENLNLPEPANDLGWNDPAFSKNFRKSATGT